MIYGYARVSTINQDLEVQVQALTAAGAEKIYKEKKSGKNVKDRPVLNELIEMLQPGDTLIVTTLDRFARSLLEGAQLVESLFERKIRVHILNMGLLEDTTVGKLLLNMLLAVAEFERSMIVERTQAGREIARQNPNFREGRPKKFTITQLDHAAELTKTHSLRQAAERTGISESTIKRHLRKKKAEALK